MIQQYEQLAEEYSREYSVKKEYVLDIIIKVLEIQRDELVKERESFVDEFAKFRQVSR